MVATGSKLLPLEDLLVFMDVHTLSYMSSFTKNIGCISFTSSVTPVAVSDLFSAEWAVSRTCILKYFGVYHFGHSQFSTNQAGGFSFHQEDWVLAQLFLKEKCVFLG